VPLISDEQVANALLNNPLTPDVRLILTDLIRPRHDAPNVITLQADLIISSQVELLFTSAYGIPDTVYCMHGIMSRQSEDDFDLGLKARATCLSLSLSSSFATRSTLTQSAQSSRLPENTVVLQEK
jgi:hypothetical protein